MKIGKIKEEMLEDYLESLRLFQSFSKKIQSHIRQFYMALNFLLYKSNFKIYIRNFLSI